MYGPLRPCKPVRSRNEHSLLKCIRPLASELRLQPGQDEIRARCSWIASSCWSTLSAGRLTVRRINVLVIVSSSLAVCRPGALCHRGVTAFVGCSRPIENHPCDARDLCRQCHRDFVDVHALLQGVDPGAEPASASIKVDDTGSCAVDEHAPQIVVPSAADSQQRRLSDSRVPSWDEAQPSSHITCGAGLPAVSSRSQDCGGYERADAGYCHQPSNPLRHLLRSHG
ncbi:hypothetical protein ACVWZM_004807 [Bradyrhizobium sp. USDA 4501]